MVENAAVNRYVRHSFLTLLPVSGWEVALVKQHQPRPLAQFQRVLMLSMPGTSPATAVSNTITTPV